MAGRGPRSEQVIAAHVGPSAAYTRDTRLPCRIDNTLRTALSRLRLVQMPDRGGFLRNLAD